MKTWNGEETNECAVLRGEAFGPRPRGGKGTSDYMAGVLVVADDLDFIFELADRLTESNRVFAARTTLEARQILAEQEIALVVLEHEPEDEAGRDLLIHLGDKPGVAKPSVIVVARKGSVAHAAQCTALGAETYFAEPFDIPILAASVKARAKRAALVMVPVC